MEGSAGQEAGLSAQNIDCKTVCVCVSVIVSVQGCCKLCKQLSVFHNAGLHNYPVYVCLSFKWQHSFVHMRVCVCSSLRECCLS